MLLRVELESKQLSVTNPIPSGKDLALLMLVCLQRANIDPNIINNIVRFFEIATPRFYIPDYVVNKDGVLLSDTTYYIDYPTKLTRTNQEAISSILDSLDIFMGVGASYKISTESITFNCFPWKNGIDVELLSRTQSYLLNAALPRDRKTKIVPTELVLSLSQAVPEATALGLTNLLHKYLVKSLPFNHQLKGTWMNTRLNDDDALYYNWVSNDQGDITALTVRSANGITDELQIFLENGIHSVTHNDLPLDIQHLETNLYTEETHLDYETVHPAFLAGKVKVNSINNSPGANILTSIESTFNYNDYQKLSFEREGNWITSIIRGVGKVYVQANPIESTVEGVRGHRHGTSSSQAYKATIRFETPTTLRAVGMHRRFGAGVVIPVGP